MNIKTKCSYGHIHTYINIKTKYSYGHIPSYEYM